MDYNCVYITGSYVRILYPIVVVSIRFPSYICQIFGTAMGTATAPMYDVCIVGAGLIGSSAAKYIAITGLKTCLIGPDEPKNLDDGRSILGAWYDEGRIAQSAESDMVLSRISSLSIDRYRDIEQQSGINFYDERGCVTIGADGDDFIRSSYNNSFKSSHPGTWIYSSEFRNRYPYFRCEPGNRTVLESSGAGCINPRRLVAAQQKISTIHGCTLLPDIVERVSQQVNGGTKTYKIELSSGEDIYSQKVLVATGAFTEFKDLLPNKPKPDWELRSQSVILGEVSDEDRLRFRNMPCACRRKPDPRIDYNFYMMPPILYPDGKYYIKLGYCHQWEYLMKSLEELRKWYTQPTPEHVVDGMKHILHFILPDFRPVSYKSFNCVTVHSVTGRPFIDLLNENFGVALAGNGCGATTCDEIGKMAAELLLTG